MMNEQNGHTLIDPANGNLALKIYAFEGNNNFDHVQRLSYYSIIFIATGKGTIKADFSQYEFSNHEVVFFSPYQPFMFTATEKMSGLVLNFHPDFFCIHKHQKEVSCNGVLFNNIYQPPSIRITKEELALFDAQLSQLKTEMAISGLAQYELLVSYLKILLINAARIKVNQNDLAMEATKGIKEPFVIQNLKDAIETHYRTSHSAGHYASMLHISPKALARITKSYFNKTLTNLISERIVIEAKRELYLTSKTVKEIGYELGFNDEYYFSRFFKTNADVSPQTYRENVGHSRSEK